MTTVAQLVAKLQALPQDLEVIIRHSAQCCCGECFMPLDDFGDDPAPTVERPYGHGQDGNTEKVVL
jgi:hypothetical protein